MKKPLIVFAALATFALVTGSVTFGSGEVSPGLIRLTTKEIKRSVVNRGSASRSPGDVVVIRQLLYNKGIRKAPLGHSDMVCTYTGNRSRQCNGTYTLPRGKIMVSGSIRYWEFYKLAIVGGTDFYSNIRGSVTGTLYARDPRKEILVFRLV
jgi:hypothetical protein